MSSEIAVPIPFLLPARCYSFYASLASSSRRSAAYYALVRIVMIMLGAVLGSPQSFLSLHGYA